MTKDELAQFRHGYWEARLAVRLRLQEIIDETSGHKEILRELIQELADEEAKEAWESVQEEFPGISRAEYEESLNETAQFIKETYFSPKGVPKPRLVRNPN